MYKAAPPKATKHDDEKILMKNSFYIRDAAADLNDAQKTELHQIARMCSVNPSTKIIVAADIDALHNQAVQYAKNIIAYLTLHCGIDKRNVFLQQASDLGGVPAGSGFNSSPTTVQRIEVKLLKDFWSL
jgi:hypothetical protein